MSQDPTDDEIRTQPDDRGYRELEFDDWPIEGYQRHNAINAHYLGAVDSSPGAVMLYEKDEKTIFEADVDEEQRRLVVREDTHRRLDPTETLGEALEDLGDRLDLESVSAFAREKLQSDDTESQENDVPQPAEHSQSEHDVGSDEDSRLEAGSFTRGNVADSADHDLEFTGSFTYREDQEQVYFVDRTFEVTLDEPEAPTEGQIDVDEQLLRAEEPETGRRAGDATPVRTARETFTIDLDETRSERGSAAVVEDQCKRFHDSHVEPL